MNNQTFLRPPAAAEYLGVSLRTVYNIAARDPDFPRKIVFSPRTVGWRKESIDQWLKNKESAQ